MVKKQLVALVGILLLIPRLLYLGIKKIITKPAQVTVRFLKGLARLPKFVYLALRAAARKFV